MKPSNISRFFNNDPIYDAYTGLFLFRAHCKAHDDQSSSGATSRRRTMRTAPGTAPPPRRAVRIADSYWVVGNSNIDSFENQAMRLSFGLKKSTDLMTGLSPAQACLGEPGTDFHVHKEFYRDSQNQLTESEFDVMWNIFCPITETVTKGSFLRAGGKFYRVRSAYTTVDEYLIAESDELDADALQTAVFAVNGQLDIATDTYPTTTVSTPVLQTSQDKFYRFRNQAEAMRAPGDRVVFVPQSALQVQVGGQFTMQGAPWRVVTVQPELDCWAVQARLA